MVYAALFVFGAALAGAGAGVLVAAAGTAPAAVLTWTRRRQCWPAAAVMLAVAAGYGLFSVHAHWVRAGWLPDALAGEALRVVARVGTVPACMPGRCRFVVHGARTASGRALPRRIRVTWRFDPAAPPAALPGAGETWVLALKLRPPRGLVNPGAFDYERWLFARRIGATASVVAHPGNRRLAAAPRWTVARLRQDLADAVREQVGSGPAQQVVLGLGLGMREALAPDARILLQQTGTAHLLAISGLHVGLVALLGFKLTRVGASLCGVWRWCPAQAAGLLGGLTAAGAYALLAGWSLPTRRAWLMALLATAAVLLRRRRWSLAHLIGAAALIVAVDPLAVVDTGFWLSVSAVALLTSFLSGRLAPPPWYHVTLAGTLLMVPASAAVFGQISVVAPLANLVAIPTVSCVLVPLVLVVLVLVAAFPQSAWPGDTAEWLVAATWQGLEAWLTALAELPRANLDVADLGPSGILGLALAAACLLLPGPVRPRSTVALLLAALVVAREPERPAPGTFRAVVVDVGQGQALVVQTRRHVLVYDTGPAAPGYVAAAHTIVPVLRARGVRRIDLLVVSHRDRDHSGGRLLLEEAFEVSRRMTNPRLAPSWRNEPCFAGRTFIWDDVRFSFLWPPAGSDLMRNDASCVLRVESAAGAALLITGDIEAPVEARLAGEHADLAAAVMTVPHHGSVSSSTPRFLASVAPDIAVVSTGYGNRWSLPSASVMNRYRRLGAQVFDTAETGAVMLEFAAAPRVTGIGRVPGARVWRAP